jgi:alpha-tubulin suppressor-like RCC1 family protein
MKLQSIALVGILVLVSGCEGTFLKNRTKSTTNDGTASDGAENRPSNEGEGLSEYIVEPNQAKIIKYGTAKLSIPAQTYDRSMRVQLRRVAGKMVDHSGAVVVGESISDRVEVELVDKETGQTLKRDELKLPISISQTFLSEEAPEDFSIAVVDRHDPANPRYYSIPDDLASRSTSQTLSLSLQARSISIVSILRWTNFAFYAFNHREIAAGYAVATAADLGIWVAESAAIPSTTIPDPETDAASTTLGTQLKIFAGLYHACAVTEDGKVRCWGANYEGQLGLQHMDIIGDTELPSVSLDVDVGGKAVELALGRYHSCAILESGAVRCWGAAAGGRLGYGQASGSGDKIGDDEAPASAGELPLGGKAIQMSAADTFTCAVIADGSVKCWGAIGHPLGGDWWSSETPVAIDFGAPVKQVACGYRHACALLTNGTVRCWGRNEQGQLGLGNSTPAVSASALSTSATVDLGGSIVTKLQTWHLGHGTCALTDTGRLRCWGAAAGGNFGYGSVGAGFGSYIGDDESPNTAGEVDVGGVVKDFAMGHDHTCAILASGKVKCWGWWGGLGYGNQITIGDDETPAAVGEVSVGADSISRLAAGAGFTCTVTSESAIRCWGANPMNGLGRGETIGDNELPSSVDDVSFRQP